MCQALPPLAGRAWEQGYSLSVWWSTDTVFTIATEAWNLSFQKVICHANVNVTIIYFIHSQKVG